MTQVPDHERREAWERVARGWERRNAGVAQMAAPVAGRMVELLDPRPGETILDIAAGVGDTGLLAAARILPGGRLITSDFASAMLDAARRRAAELGVEHVEFLAADAHDLPLPDGSVDGALCRWGYMLMPAPEGALRETRRVLRDGVGRAAFAVWTGPERNPWASALAGPFVRLGHVPPPDPSEPGMFALGDPAVLERVVRAAGFASVELHEVELAAEHESFEAWWETALDMSANLSGVVARLSADEIDEVRAAVQHEAEAYRAGAGYRLPGVCLVGLAR